MTDLDQFTRAYWGRLRFHAYRMTGSLLDAEDVAQETMLRAIEMGPALDNVGNHLEWIHVAATEVAVSLLRDRRPFPIEEFDLPDLVQTTGPGGEAEVHLVEGDGSWPSATLDLLFPLQFMTPEQRAVLVLREGMEDGDRIAATALGVTIPEVFGIGKEAEKRREQVRKRWGGHVPFIPLRDEAATARIFNRFVEVFQLRDRALLQSLLWDQVEMIVQGQRVSGQDFVASACAELSGRLGDQLRVVPVWLNGCHGGLFWSWREGRSEWMRCAAVILLCNREKVRSMKWFLDGHLLRGIRVEEGG